MNGSHAFIRRPRRSGAAAIGFALALTVGFVAVAPAVQAAGGDQQWAALYGHHYSNEAHSVVASPDGSTVYVTGSNWFGEHQDYGTVAYAAATGDAIWAGRYNGPADGYDTATAIAVAPDGSAVYVTGLSYTGPGSADTDFATVAYAADSGTRMWVRRYGTGGNDWATAIGVSPDGSAVYVTGTNAGAYATIGYDAATGEKLWAGRYNGGFGGNYPQALGVSPDGMTVYVTGFSQGGYVDIPYDYATVAYDTATGDRIWARRHDGPYHYADYAEALGVSPNGRTVFVTGTVSVPFGHFGHAFDYATIAYDTATGDQIWARRYNGPGDSSDRAYALGVSPDGAMVFVTGITFATESANDYATIAYDALTGTTTWVRLSGGPGAANDIPSALGVSHDGETVYVTGESRRPFDPEFETAAYAAATGTTLWLRRSRRTTREGSAAALAVSPDDTGVFVTGTGWDLLSRSQDYLTIAYSAS